MFTIPDGTNVAERMDELVDELQKLSRHDKLTGAQEVRFETINAELRALQHVDQLARVRQAAAGGHSEAGTPGSPDLPVQRDDARRALDGLRSVHDEGRQRLTVAFDQAEARQDGGGELSYLSRWLLATSSPAYARAVGKLFRDPENGHREFDGQELEAYQRAKLAQRAMSIGTDSAGGFLLPTHLDPQIMLSNAGAVDPMRQICRVETIGTDTWNGVSSAGVTASWDAEATEVSDDSPTLAQPSVPTHKGAAFVAASIEAAMDTNIGDQVARLFIDAKERLEAAAFIEGTGTGQPTGLTVALGAGQKVATATADTLVAADVLKPITALSSRWQPRATHLSNLATMLAIAAFETAGGALRFPEVANGQLLRKRYLEASSLDTAGATATAGNDYVLIAGDFSQYLIVDRIGATVEYIPHLFATGNNRPSGQRGWYMYWRTGGDLLIDDAMRALTA